MKNMRTGNILLTLLFVTSCFCGNVFIQDVVLDKASCVGINNCKVVNGTDAFPTIQGALNNGGLIHVHGGEYVVSKNLNIYGNTSLVGDGINKTIIRLKDYAAPYKIGNFMKAGLIRGTFQNDGGCDDILIANLTLDGNKLNQHHDHDSKYGRYGLFTEACINTTFDGVETKNMQGYGFDPHGAKPSDYAHHLTIVNCVSHDNDWDGFTIDQTIDVIVENCSAYNNGRHGFNVVTGTKNSVLNNVSSYNNGYYYYKNDPGCGVSMQNNMFYGTSGLVLANSTLTGDKKGGFCTTGNVSNIAISNTMIVNNNRCLHLAFVVNGVYAQNITCVNATRFLVQSNAVNISVVNSTINGKDYNFPPLPKSPKSPLSPKSPKLPPSPKSPKLSPSPKSPKLSPSP
jgi:hypothetical protein